ncbi:MAG: hypothetical protein LBM98_12555 [Oscillospiraceae bacterium]|nr:hypothetical protein [Oscillospiraceae bacterium]
MQLSKGTPFDSWVLLFCLYTSILRLRAVCFPPGTGLLRACNVLRIAGIAALRKDRAGRSPALSRRNAPGRWTWVASAHGAGRAGLKPAPTFFVYPAPRVQPPRTPRPNLSSLIFDM